MFTTSITSLITFHVDAKCEILRVIHPLWDGMLKEDGYDPECEHPHCPSICWYNTASFAMVSRGPDMTSLLLIRMSYLSYTLLCTYNSSVGVKHEKKPFLVLNLICWEIVFLKSR